MDERLKEVTTLTFLFDDLFYSFKSFTIKADLCEGDEYFEGEYVKMKVIAEYVSA